MATFLVHEHYLAILSGNPEAKEINEKGPFMKVAFFPGCMVDMFYPEVGIAAVNVLERLGCPMIMFAVASLLPILVISKKLNP